LKDTIKIKGLSTQESLIMIRDARVGGLNFIQIAERLGLDAETIFRAHIKLLAKKLLAWKTELTKDEEESVVITWYVPDQPEKRHRMRWSFKVDKNRTQRKEVTVDEDRPKD